MTLTITSKEDNEVYQFEVFNTSNLSRKEVQYICKEMNVKAIFVEGKFYERD
jgi:hypothetical protein